MRDTYRRPTGQVEHENEIKRSRFIALIGRVTNEEEARAVIDAARPRLPDAPHLAPTDFTAAAGSPQALEKFSQC